METCLDEDVARVGDLDFLLAGPPLRRRPPAGVRDLEDYLLEIRLLTHQAPDTFNLETMHD